MRLCVFKKVKMKIYVAINDGTQPESSILYISPKGIKEFWKIWKTTMKASVIKWIFTKIACTQYLCWN